MLLGRCGAREKEGVRERGGSGGEGEVEGVERDGEKKVESGRERRERRGYFHTSAAGWAS